MKRLAKLPEFKIWHSTVKEVLKYTKGKIRLDVELKEEGYEEEIVELLSRYFKRSVRHYLI
jgi:hypothetical protein